MNQKGMGDLLKQAARMRKEMDRVSGELKERYVEANTGDGKVQVTFNGQQELVKIVIHPDLVTPAPGGKTDVELLEDLILAAVSQGLEKSKALMNEEMKKVTGGGVPGLPGLF